MHYNSTAIRRDRTAAVITMISTTGSNFESDYDQCAKNIEETHEKVRSTQVLHFYTLF